MRKAALGAAVMFASVSATAPAQSTPQRSDVRQIVTFQFLPGRADSAAAVYRRELLPAYVADTAMRRFRAYSEAESPEPLDLIVVSQFDGMAGMDASNAALRSLSSSGRSVFGWYGVLSAITQRHHDQFAEMLPALCVLGTGVGDGGRGRRQGTEARDGGRGRRQGTEARDGAKRQSSELGSEPGLRAHSQSLAHVAKSRPAASSKTPCDPARIAADTTARLVVMEYIRAAPGARAAYEALIASTLLPIERSSPGLRWSETGRLLISDGWDFVRFYGVDSLGAWHDYQSLLQSRRVIASTDRLVAARKTIIVRPQRALAVR